MMYKLNNTLTLFQDYIGVFDIDVNNIKIKDELYNASLKKLSSNSLNTHFEDFELNDFFNKDTEINRFANIINQWGQERNLKATSMWAHIHQPLESTSLHHHLPSTFSFVYYVSLPEHSGGFAFDFSSISGPILPIEIKEKMLMFFPSWLPHKVTKNLSSKKRISISGNLDIIEDNINESR